MVIVIYMAALNSRTRIPGRIGSHDFYRLSENQKDIIIHIALNGPIDAYRTNNELKFSLSTTQLAFKKLNEYGLIEFKRTVKGNTEQLRKLYGLTSYGFCLVTNSILKIDETWCSLGDDMFKEFLKLNEELFPELLKKWSVFIDRSKSYYESHPVQDWKKLPWLKPLPDISTEIWCAVLLKVCHNVVDFVYWEDGKHDPHTDFREIGEADFNEEFKVCLVECLTGYLTSPHLEGLIFSLKQDKELCADLIPGLSNWARQYEKQMIRINKILDEIK